MASRARVGADRARPLRVAITAPPGCMLSAVTGLEDAFAVATMHAHVLRQPGGFEVEVLTSGGRPAVGFAGRSLPGVGPLGEDTWDLVIVPPVFDAPTGPDQADGELVAWLSAQGAAGAAVASVCTGAFFVAATGLLDGRVATTNPVFAPVLSGCFPAVQVDPTRRLIDHGDVICAGTTTAFLDLALHVIEGRLGHEVAVRTAKTLAMDLRRGDQAPYEVFIQPRAHDDAAVHVVQDWLADHYGESATLAQLARLAALSPRSLSRRFRQATGDSVLAYQQRLRLHVAKRMLESTLSNVAEITYAVGYRDPRSFTRLFRQRVGVGPGEYRRRFGRVN